MIDGSETCNRQLTFELQNSLVKWAVIFSYFSLGCLIIESGAYVLGLQLHKFSHL